MTQDSTELTGHGFARRGYVVVFLGFLTQILLQFGLQLLLARLFGASREMDAYGAAMTLPVSLSAIVVGTLGAVLITSLGSGQDRSANAAFAGTLVLGVSFGSIAVSALGAAFSSQIMFALHPHFDHQKIESASGLFRILIWLFPANTLIGLLQCVLNARLRFAVPAAAGAIGPLFTVWFVWQFGDTTGIAVVAWGTLGGAVANLLVQFPSATADLSLSSLRASLVRMKSLVHLALPIFIGTLVLRIDPLVDRYVSSGLDDGSIARLGYAQRVLTIFIMLASGILSTVSFPRLANRAAEGAGPLAVEFAAALRVLVTLVLPAVVVLVAFSESLIHDLFERGEFTAADTQSVATLLQIYAIVLAGASLGEISAKSMYVLRDSVTPLLIGSLALVAGFLFKLWLVPQQGILLLAAITAGVYFISGCAQLLVLLRRLGMGEGRELMLHALRCGLASTVAAGIGFVTLQTGISYASAVGLTLGASGYFTVLAALDGETRSTMKHLVDQLRNRPSAS